MHSCFQVSLNFDAVMPTSDSTDSVDCKDESPLVVTWPPGLMGPLQFFLKPQLLLPPGASLNALAPNKWSVASKGDTNKMSLLGSMPSFIFTLSVIKI